MSHEVLTRLLDGNDRHVESLSDGHFEAVRDGQDPPVVSVSCSDSRVPSETTWGIETPGELFTSVNVGNQAWTRVDGELVINDAVGYAVSSLGVSDIVVLGHTGCGAITAAYKAVKGEDLGDVPPSVEEAVSRLVPLVEEAHELGVFDDETPTDEAVNRLVEYAVVRQVEFLSESTEVPVTTDCWGFVYDFQQAYGDDGGAYLVAANGESEPEKVAEQIPDEFASHVQSIR